MTDESLAELDAALAEVRDRYGFLQRYEQLECLANGHGTETFLVREKGGSGLYIAKCYDRGVYGEIQESVILKALSHEKLPAFVEEYQDEKTICVVREYMEGTPLNQYLSGRCLPPAEAVSLCAGLCDILTYLHSRKPPVIHRDVKPHNVIVQEGGGVALVDFDIARVYDDAAGADTRVIGTRVYAPPEQYGFSQTDGRADIYSLGVLLCQMLTGGTDVAGAKIGDRRLAAVVRRCTAFSPQQRFSSAVAVKKALLRALRLSSFRPLRAAAACVLLLAALCTGFALGRFTRLFAPAQVQAVQFAEPAIERAVRAQLGKSAADPLTEQDLVSVRGIYIFGNEVAASNEPFIDGLGGRLGGLPKGEITSLEDVALLPNLEVIYVNYQPLIDLSPLMQLKNLRDVNLRHTRVSDLSPLAGMASLENVGLYDTNVSDLSPLTQCPRLSSLEIGQTLVLSIADIPALPGLKRLSLRSLPLYSLDGIERFTRLQWLCLTGTGVTDLTPLKALNMLTEVAVGETMRDSIIALGNISFSVVYD